MKLLAFAAVAALSVAAPSVSHAAVQVNITNSSFSLGSKDGTINFAPSPFNGQTFGFGQFQLTGNYVVGGAAASFLSYCVDLFTGLAVPTVFDITPLSQLFTGVKADNITKLLANTNPTNAEESAAVQLAMWEIVFDTAPSLDVSAGVTQGDFWAVAGNSAAARVTANTYLSQLAAWQLPTNGQAMLLYSQSSQTQVIFVAGAVPEAATWTMMVSGFGIAGAAIRRRKRTTAIAAA